MNICIMPGHGKSKSGSYDPGAVYGDREEYTLACDIAIKTAAALRADGHRVTLLNSRSNLYLTERVEKINSGRYDLALEIHLNAGGGTGTEVFYQNGCEMGGKYAAVISAAVAGEIGIRDRGAKVKFNAKGKDYFAILRETHCTALLIETGFIDSAADGALLETPVFRDRCAKAIAKAVSEASGKENFLVKITTPSLNIRSGPGVSYPWRGLVREGTVLTVTDTRGAWGRLKSGAGWISLSPEYVRRLGDG